MGEFKKRELLSRTGLDINKRERVAGEFKKIAFPPYRRVHVGEGLYTLSKPCARYFQTKLIGFQTTLGVLDQCIT